MDASSEKSASSTSNVTSKLRTAGRSRSSDASLSQPDHATTASAEKSQTTARRRLRTTSCMAKLGGRAKKRRAASRAVGSFFTCKERAVALLGRARASHKYRFARLRRASPFTVPFSVQTKIISSCQEGAERHRFEQEKDSVLRKAYCAMTVVRSDRALMLPATLVIKGLSTEYFSTFEDQQPHATRITQHASRTTPRPAGRRTGLRRRSAP